ncbi:MAG: peroxiredoxin [Flavobacteriales bacterium]|jgi:peroxiredoxin Q/BCP|nr:peroxiredoxin [Flavobacteriales bacterium]
MLRTGRPAPPIVLPDPHGRPHDLAATWAEGPVVLFFYPRAGTPVCTMEACAFRDAHAEFHALGATVLGVSRDAPAAQADFVRARRLPFTLLCDVDGAAHRAFRVRGPLGLLPGRITYVIAPGGTIMAAYRGTFAWDAHVRRALAALRQGMA